MTHITISNCNDDYHSVANYIWSYSMLHCPDVDYEAIIRVGNISEKYQDGM